MISCHQCLDVLVAIREKVQGTLQEDVHTPHRHAPTVITQDDNEDNDFMPQRHLPLRPPSLEDTEDPIDYGGFASTHPHNLQSPSRRRQSSYLDSMNWHN